MEYLFAYGTLRKGYDLELKSQIADQLKYLGKGKVKAALYDLGAYPGAVKEEKGSEVIGDVFIITDPVKVLTFLDDYEGPEYVREKTIISLRSGEKLKAWIYWYRHMPGEENRIRYKDYFNYLKYKSLL